MGRIITDPAVRKQLYTIMTLIVPILVGYGVISDADASKYVALIGALGGALTTILAAANTAPVGRHADDGVPDELEAIPAGDATSDTKSDAAH